MSMIPFRNGRKEPSVNVPSVPASPETVAHFERVAQTERELREARETIDRITHETDDAIARLRAQCGELTREIMYLRDKLAEAETRRDDYHTRALEAETTLRTVAATLIEAAERARIAAAAMGNPAAPPHGHEGAQDLDELAAGVERIAEKFGANNRQDE